MARITVEDCIEKLPNRYELVVLATQRARELCVGAIPTVPRNRDKPTMIALREIAAGTVTTEMLRESIVRRMQGVGSHDAESEEPNNGDAFGPDQVNDAFAEVFRGDAGDLAAEPEETDPDYGGGDLARMPEPSDDELAELGADLSLSEAPA